MPDWCTFQAVSVQGKPQIVISTAPKEEPKSRRIDYKTRSQKFPLREQAQTLNLESVGNNIHQIYTSSSPSASIGAVMNTRSKYGGKTDDTITITSSQLAVILQNAKSKSSGKALAGDNKPTRLLNTGDSGTYPKRQGSYKEVGRAARPLSHDRGRVNKSAAVEKSKNHKSEIASQSLQRGLKQPSNPAGRPEHLLGLLNKAPKNLLPLHSGGRENGPSVPFNSRGMKDGGREERREEMDSERKYSQHRRASFPECNEREEDDEEDSAVLDAVMKRVIAENKDKLSEEQLVELLSQVYVQAKQKKSTREEKHEKRSETHKNRRGNYHIEEESDAEEDYKNYEANNRRRRHEKTDGRHNVHSPNEISDEDIGEDSVRQRNINTSNYDSHETNLKPPTVPLKSMSMVEMKRLQWEKEKGELESMSNYSPWNKPPSTRISQRPTNVEIKDFPIGNKGERRDRVHHREMKKSFSDELNDSRLPRDIKVSGDPGDHPQTLVEHNRREKERALTEAMLNKRSGADRSLASRLAGANEEDSNRQKELARQKWITELNAQRAENELIRQRELQHGAEIKPTLVSNVHAVIKPPQFARGRGLADLQEREDHGKRVNQTYETERKDQFHSSPSHQSLPPWLR